jgi:hypothetical protein
MQHQSTIVSRRARIVSAQGTFQLINVLSVLKYQLTNEVAEDWEDHLVLGGFYTERCNDTNLRMIESCMKISQYWKFRSTNYLSDEDLSIDVSFRNTAERVNQKLGLSHVDTVYVSRNWQPFNETLLEVFKNATKICYGDGLGPLDIKSQWQDVAINPEGYRKIDKAYLFVRVEGDTKMQWFHLVDNIIQPPINYFINTVADISSSITDLQMYASNLLDNNHLDKKLTLVTTSNLTEAGCLRNNKSRILKKMLILLLRTLNRGLAILGINVFKNHLILLEKRIKLSSDLQSLKLEVSMYFDQIIRCCDISELLIVKSHPRETLNQSFHLVDKLSGAGYEAIVMDQNFSCFPIELLFGLLSFSKVVSLGSSSAISAKLMLVNIEDHKIIPSIDWDIMKKYLRFPDHYPVMHLTSYKTKEPA